MGIAFWVCVTISAISALVSLGYALTGVRAASPETVTPARYALARSIALAAVAVAAFVTASVGFAAAVAAAMIIVQALDAFVGMSIKDRVKTVGPALTSLAGIASLVWMLAV